MIDRIKCSTEIQQDKLGLSPVLFLCCDVLSMSVSCSPSYTHTYTHISLWLCNHTSTCYSVSLPTGGSLKKDVEQSELWAFLEGVDGAVVGPLGHRSAASQFGHKNLLCGGVILNVNNKNCAVIWYLFIFWHFIPLFNKLIVINPFQHELTFSNSPKSMC